MQKLNKKEVVMENKDSVQPVASNISKGAEDTDDEESIIGMPDRLKPNDSDSNDSDDKASIVMSAELKETFHDCENYIGRHNGEANDQPMGQQEGVRPTKTTDTGNVVRLNMVADSKGMHYFNLTDQTDPSEGLGSIHELQIMPCEWVESSWETPEDIDPAEIDWFLNKIKTDQLMQGPATFDSFAFAAQQSVEFQEWVEENPRSAVHHKKTVNHKELEALQPCLAFAPLRVTRKTLECTTQWALEQLCAPLHRHQK